MEATSTEVQNSFGAYLKYASIEDVYITRNGQRVAVLKGYAGKLAEGESSYKAAKPKMSLEEFFDFAGRSKQSYEFIDGEVIVLASPTFRHQELVLALASHLREKLQNTAYKPVIAPFDLILQAFHTTNVVQPDLLVICDLENVHEDGGYRGIPAITIEILSQSTRNHDMVKKLDLYRVGGVSEYWIVDPDLEQIFVYEFADFEVENFKVYGVKDRLKSPALQALTIDLSAVFS